MANNNYIKRWELEWQHYKLQNESMEKGRTFLWLIESALFLSWYTLNCPLLKKLIIVIGIIISISWFIVFKRFRDAIDLTVRSLINIEIKWLELPDKPYIFTKEDIAFKDKWITSQKLWWDQLHPFLFIIIWSFLLYPFFDILSYLLILFVIISFPTILIIFT